VLPSEAAMSCVLVAQPFRAAGIVVDRRSCHDDSVRPCKAAIVMINGKRIAVVLPAYLESQDAGK